ncbi:MAG TPA: DUF2059 domain-containing protein [Pyrinomonadaceae bacterium]|nr:DUF2059 domain-containing protein [Pyrinomonadaceae bacterium]
MKRFCLAFLLVTFCQLCAAAQEAGGVSAEKARDIRRLMEVTKANDMGLQVARQSLDALRESTTLPEAQRDRILKILEEELMTEFGNNKMAEAMVPIYDRHFTAEEIKGLLAFYETPLGRKVVETLPEVMREAQTFGAERGRIAGLRAMTRMMSEGLLTQEKPASPTRKTTRRKRR